MENNDLGAEFYERNGINVTTISDADNNEHYFLLKFPNGEKMKYDILLEHYHIQGYMNFRKNMLKDVKLKLRQMKLNSINKKLAWK